LDNLDTYERIMVSHDVPQETVSLHNAEASLTNTSKHHWLGPVNGYCSRKIVEMLSAIVGSQEKLRERPLLTFVTCPGSPLTFSKEHCEIIMEGARSGLAVNIVSMTMAGGSAPVTLAGTLVVLNAEVLGSLVLNQLIRKGSPLIYGSSTCPPPEWPSWPANMPCRALRPVVRAIAKWVTPRLGMKRHSPGYSLRWQGSTWFTAWGCLKAASQ
jgi:trimethylamine--corrinoid protein Co-methyltransferase